MEDSIRKLVKANNKITRQQMVDKIGVSKKTVERKIKEMDDVHYVGRGYSGHWEIGREDND